MGMKGNLDGRLPDGELRDFSILHRNPIINLSCTNFSRHLLQLQPSRPPAITIRLVKSCGVKDAAVAVDHGNLFVQWAFMKPLTKRKAILGCEMYVAKRTTES
jgi:hypothetical protein